LLNSHVQGLLRCFSAGEPSSSNANFSEFLILLGSERLRILALGCALAEFAGKHLPVETMRDFWQHSILTALLSERIAREAHPASTERAYLAGLLHDIGKLPLLIAAREQPDSNERLTLALHDEPEAERAYFGLDHAEIGRWMGLSGNLPGWMVSVLDHHHDHTRATEDATLVAIVANADHCSQIPNGGASLAGILTWHAGSHPFGVN
jgi:HD-like signal output (HDOD) protein